MTDSPALITIYTDGGADPNPGPGGWGAVLLFPGGEVRELSGGEPRTTNNRMELTAAIRALEAIPERSRARVLTDSQYLRRGVTEWLPGWIRRNWQRKDGELQNVDLWRRLAELIAEHHLQWAWVRGHAGNRWNERADVLATAATRAQKAGAPKRSTAASTAEAPVAAEPEADVFLRVSGSGDRGGWAVLVRSKGEESILSGSAIGMTPNQLDLAAAAEALERLPPGTAVAVHTGSDYLRNGAALWLPAWRRSGWKTKEGQPVKNRELWQRLEAAMRTRRVEWPPVKGRDVPELEALGKVAAEAARG